MFLDSSKNYNFRISADEVLFLFELFNQKRDTIEKKEKDGNVEDVGVHA